MAPSLRKRTNKNIETVASKEVLGLSKLNNILKQNNDGSNPAKRTRILSKKQEDKEQIKPEIKVNKNVRKTRQKENTQENIVSRRNIRKNKCSAFKNIVFQSTLNESKFNSEDLEASLLAVDNIAEISKISPTTKKCKELQVNKINNVNCFGFDEEDFQLPIPKQVVKQKDDMKPWRCSFSEVLAIIKQKQLESIKSSMNQQSTVTSIKNVDVKESREQKKTVKLNVKEPKKTVTLNPQPEVIKDKNVKKPKLVQKKLTEMTKMKPKTRIKNKQANYNNFFKDQNDSNEVFPTEIGTPGRNKPARRSYERKFKETEKVEEPSSDEILVEINKKKRTKHNKKTKEDKRLEEWSKSINVMFDEVDKYELKVD